MVKKSRNSVSSSKVIFISGLLLLIGWTKNKKLYAKKKNLLKIKSNFYIKL